MQNLTDEQLVEKYLKGEKQALEILISRYLKVIYSFAYGYANNGADAEDIAQEAFVKIWKNIRKFDQKKKFKPWLFEITKNTAIDLLRKKKTVPFSRFENEEGENILINTLQDESPLPLAVCERQDMLERLDYAVSKLCLNYREVVFMRLKNGLTFQEIAQILDESINTIKTRYRRALNELKENISYL